LGIGTCDGFGKCRQTKAEAASTRVEPALSFAFHALVLAVSRIHLTEERFKFGIIHHDPGSG
jgi:hypothetical protein